MNDASRRLMIDLRKLKKDPPVGIMGAPSPDNIMFWNCAICGVDDTLWEDAVFKATLSFPETYPKDPPYAKFISRVFHPNVFPSGEICIDILRKNWSPAYDVSSILLSIQALLTDPNPAANANAEACTLYIKNRPKYEKKVKECIEESWITD